MALTPTLNQMPTELDDLLEKLDVEALKGNKTRPGALVLALTDIVPFHPQTIKLRLRLLQRRRENTEMEVRYARDRLKFLEFVGADARCDGRCDTGRRARAGSRPGRRRRD